MMVNSSSNINKTNNNLSTQITKHKKTQRTVLEMQMLSCSWHTYVAVLNRLMEPHHSNLEF